MNCLFGPYIEKWMHFITIKNMLLLTVGSLIITDLGLYILMLLFPESPFFKTLIWEVISPVEFEIVGIIGYVLGLHYKTSIRYYFKIYMILLVSYVL